MILKETQDNKDILIMLMIQERDNYIELKEQENKSLKELLIKQVEENRHLLRIIKQLKNKRNG